MAIARVGSSQANSGNPVTSLQLTRTPTTIGNLMIVGADVFPTTAPPAAHPFITDTQGHTWLPCNPIWINTVNTNTHRSWYTLAKNTST